MTTIVTLQQTFRFASDFIINSDDEPQG